MRSQLLLIAACSLLGCGPTAGVKPAAPTTTTATTTAPTGAAIVGTVRDAASAKPLSFVSVTAVSAAEQRSTDTSKSDGSYRLEGLDAGSYTIIATYSDHTIRYDEVAVPATGDVTVDISFDTDDESHVDFTAKPNAPSEPSASRRSGGIRGVVRDLASKELLPGAVVAATTPALRDARMAIADDDGAYLLPGLPPGTYTLSVYYHLVDRGNIELRRSNITIAAGEIKVVDLDLDAETDE